MFNEVKKAHQEKHRNWKRSTLKYNKLSMNGQRR